MKVANESLKLKAENGLYTALSLGVEYNNFLTELSYVHTNAKVKVADVEKYKYNNNSVRLSIGYKFNF